ncbi:hypothetical protein [Cellulomonas sp. Y8]|uniref:hypothetical protein n=1 Tax=Cellulomonas sp. Y8 TaxID=2591145 RepID=UPI003D72EA84
MKKTLGRASATFVAAGMVATLCGFAPATAHTPTDTDPTVIVIEAPMVVGGFDADVARANGYKIVTDANGEKRSVPVTAAAKAADAQLLAKQQAEGTVSPLATVVTGDCGSSRIVIADGAGFRDAGISTSFTVNRPAVGYSWFVDITGNSTSTRRTFTGGLLSRTTWQHTFAHTVPAAGTYIASVARTSNAVLNNGTICFSGGPSDSDYIS